jgi:hypothetical protein
MGTQAVSEPPYCTPEPPNNRAARRRRRAANAPPTAGAPAGAIEPRYRWYTIAESAVVHELGPFAWTYGQFEIPPRSELTVKADCTFPGPMQIVDVLPHMHRFGVAFQASFLGGSLDGQVFLDSPGYDPDKGGMTQYDPAIDLSQGDGASFSCTWHNTLDEPL